jgi:hypothetical protein
MGAPKLTAEQALDIYLLMRSKRYWQRELAEAFAISQSAVSLIMHRRRWCTTIEELTMTDKNAEFEERLAASEKRVAELEAKLSEARKPAEPFRREPMERIDYTAGATMDAETRRELAKAFPDSLARDLRDDALNRPNPVTGATPAQLTQGGNERVQIQRGTGWAEPNPLSAPPGVPIMDRLMDMQDKIDKADLARRLGTTVKGQSK